MEVEKLQRLNDQRRYIVQLENFKNRVLKTVIDAEHVDSIVITVETAFNGNCGISKIPYHKGQFMSPYDGCPMREEDRQSFIRFY